MTKEELEKENAELKEINEGYRKSRDRLISIGFPNFKDCKEYSEHLTKAREIIKKLKALYFSPVVTKDDVKRQDEILVEVEQFLSEVEK